MGEHPNDKGAKPAAVVASESRRRFLKAGIIAAPFIVSLAARPARAQEVAAGSLGTYSSGGGGTAAPSGVDDTDAFRPL